MSSFPHDTHRLRKLLSVANGRGHFEPAVYDGPSVSILSSDISSSQFTATLRLTNATTWIGGGKLNIDSSDAGVIWALGSNPPNDPSNPSSDFQQHKIMGIFSVDMKSAQVDQNTNPLSDTIREYNGINGLT